MQRHGWRSWDTVISLKVVSDWMVSDGGRYGWSPPDCVRRSVEDQRGINTACTFCGCTPWLFFSVVSILNRCTFPFPPLDLMACTHRLTILPWHVGSCTAGFLYFLFLFNGCCVYKWALGNDCVWRNSMAVSDPLCLPCKEWWKNKVWRVCCPPEGFFITWEPQKVVATILHLCLGAGGSREGRERWTYRPWQRSQRQMSWWEANTSLVKENELDTTPKRQRETAHGGEQFLIKRTFYPPPGFTSGFQHDLVTFVIPPLHCDLPLSQGDTGYRLQHHIWHCLMFSNTTALFWLALTEENTFHRKAQ